MTKWLSVLMMLCSFMTAAQQGQFEQHKHFAGFDNAFVSTGSYRLTAQQLWWHTQTPIENVLRIDGEGVFERQGEDQFVKQAQSGAYSSLLQALLQQDPQQLAQFFISGPATRPERIAAKPWSCLKLLAQSQELKSLFTHLISCQDNQQQVRFIGLYERKGTRTEIILTPNGATQ